MAEESRQGKKARGRIGEVRCQNCFERFWPEEGADRARCPSCGWDWHVSWVGKVAKIRKPVWESWDRQLDETDRAKG